MERLTEKLNDNYITRQDLRNNGHKKCMNKLGKLEDLEEQIGMPLEEFFNKIGEHKEYMVTPNNKSFYPATLLGGTYRNDGTFVYCVLVHDIDNKMPFHDYFAKIYTQEEAEKALEVRKNVTE